jgi:hypothetical protein
VERLEGELGSKTEHLVYVANQTGCLLKVAIDQSD